MELILKLPHEANNDIEPSISRIDLLRRFVGDLLDSIGNPCPSTLQLLPNFFTQTLAAADLLLHHKE